MAGDVTTGLTVRVDRAASEGTANLPTLLTADMVLVTNGPRPLTGSPPAPCQWAVDISQLGQAGLALLFQH